MQGYWKLSELKNGQSLRKDPIANIIESPCAVHYIFSISQRFFA